MKNITLLIIERLGLLRLLNQIYSVKGLDVLGLKRAGELGEKCELSADEKKEIKWIDLGNGAANINLDLAKKLEITVAISDEEINLIKDAIILKNKTKTFGNTDIFIFSICKKLDIDIEKI